MRYGTDSIRAGTRLSAFQEHHTGYNSERAEILRFSSARDVSGAMKPRITERRSIGMKGPRMKDLFMRDIPVLQFHPSFPPLHSCTLP